MLLTKLSLDKGIDSEVATKLRGILTQDIKGMILLKLENAANRAQVFLNKMGIFYDFTKCRTRGS